MASPVFGSAGAQLQGSASTMNVDVPAGVQAGHIIVVTAFVETATVTAMPTGFAQATGSPQAALNHRLYVMWKRATGADANNSTYDFTLSGSTYRNAQAIRYTGAVASGDPWNVVDAAVNADAGSQGGVTPAVDVTTDVVDTLLVFAGSNWAGGSWTPPTGFTERRDTGDGVVTVADEAQASAGSSGSVSATATGSSNGRAAWLGAIMSLAGTITPSGTADLGLSLDVSAAGGRTSAATASAGVVFDLAAAGSAPPVGGAGGTANLGLALDVSATGTAPAVGGAGGGAAAQLVLAVTVAGSRTSEALTGLGVDFDVSAIGHAPGIGAAAGRTSAGLAYTIAAAGVRRSAASLAAGLGFDVAASGSATHRGTVDLGIGFAVDAAGPPSPGGSAHLARRPAPAAVIAERLAPTATAAHRSGPTVTGR